MPVITILWSMIAAASLTMMLVHFIVWLRRRDRYAHLSFAFVALSVTGVTLCALGYETASTPAEYGRAMWMIEFAIFAYFVSVVVFVRTYLKAGPIWLGGIVVVLRLLFLVMNLPTEFSINYASIDSIEQVVVLGEPLARPVGTLSPWRHFGELSEVGLFLYLVLATVVVWRRGEKRKAILISASNAAVMLLAAGHAALVFHGLLPPPMMVAPSILFVVMAMSYDLSSEVLHAAELTETVQARESQLRESEKRMDLAGQAAELGHWVWDMRADEIWATQKGRSLYGIGPDERVTFERFIQTIHPEDRDAVHRGINDSLMNKDDFNVEYRVVLPDSGTRWVLARGRFEYDEAGQPARMLGVSLDITHRRIAEERALQIVEASPNAIMLIDFNGSIGHVNSKAERMFDRPRQQMQGLSLDTLIPDLRIGADQHDFAGRLNEVSIRAARREYDLNACRSDGQSFPIEISVSPVQTPDGAFMLVSVIDITERKQAELESARQRNELAHLSRVTMLGELSGSLAHELNQPLASILSNAQAAQQFLAKDQADLDEVREILQDIVDEDKRAGEVIRRLRLLLKKGEILKEPLDINETLHDVLRLVRSDLINHGVHVQLQLTSERLEVAGDPVQLQQILLNLVMNACDAMAQTPTGQRLLLITTERTDQQAVHLCVTDHGCGIPENQLRSIFEPFVTSKPEGMGLGLAVCQTIVKMHDGKLWATNNHGPGATFHLLLPAASKTP